VESRVAHHQEPDWSALIGIYEEALEELRKLNDSCVEPLSHDLVDRYGEAVLEQHVQSLGA
jgi:hypothetical protein